jgi:cysteinyl-tRNA synthetase
VSLRIHNTLSRQKEPFVPLVPGEAGMYVCGVTPYDVSHIGHARSALVFDVIARYLRYRGYRLRVVKNFTDVDDKIIARAAQLGTSPRELAERYIAAYRRDMAALGVVPPDVEPRATEHIPEMLALIDRLRTAGVAYPVDGDVYFEVRRFAPYGQLSGKALDELLAGARVEVDARKRDPRDFALWKAAKPGEPSWPSPWGAGRPGWHIECSAMAMKYLGETFDLHGGGEDLVFPHHECEIAQAEAATGRPLARYWLHNGFVNLGAEKMSKSLGNILTIEALLGRHEPEALRLYLLQTHYRSPVEFSEDRLREVRRPLDRLRQLVEAARLLRPTGSPDPETGGAPAGASEGSRPEDASPLADRLTAHQRAFEAAMDDDFNTPQALAALFDLSRTLHGYRDERLRVTDPQRPLASPGPFLAGVTILERLAGVLGLLEGAAAARTPGRPAAWTAAVEALVRERDEARRRRDFGRADAIRRELEARGVAVEDTPAGTTWKVRAVPGGG